MGERSVTLGRDAHGSAIFTGDISVQFGLASAPATYRGLIRRFLRAYLGSPEAPVPFGGRDAEIAELNRWLADPDAPSNLLVTAPAGRGKTALLTRWLSQVDREAWPVVFVPISIRYGTNHAATFYQALAARLATTLDKNLPPTPVDPASFYRDKVVEYLDLFYESDRRCLIVIDGLDEAAGWQVDTSALPLDPAPGLRIVASARLLAGDHGSADWLRRLGWNALRARTFEVSLLDRDGIADVIKNMGYPLALLSGQVDILAELLRLTSGEPLLIELYVTALLERGDQAARLRAEELRDLNPGFAGFFKDWWEQQRRVWRDAGTVPYEQMVQAMLAVLACALGPLRLVELAYLVREVHGVDEIFSADSLQPIGRFVIGDGISVGYSFSHPKLADYFRDNHFGGAAVILRTRAGFIQWGRTTVRALNEAKLTPSESPEYPYLLEHYSQHWSATSKAMGHPSERAEALLELVSDGWRRAWEAYEGGFQGFAGDVRAAWDALRQARDSSDHQSVARYLGAEIRCVLCLSSICSLGTNIPADLLPWAVEWDAMSIRQAEHIAELKGGEPESRVQALLALAPHLSETSRLALLEDIRVILLDEEKRSQTLVQLADCLASAEERHSILREVRRVALRSPKPNAVAGILRSLLPLLPDDEDRMSLASKALEAANRVDVASTRALLLADIALYLSPNDASASRAQAIDAAQSTTPATRRCRVLIELALRLPKEHPQKSSLGHGAIRIAELAISDSDKKDPNSQFYIQGATMVRSLALALLASLERDPDKRNHILNDAESTARSAPDGYHQIEALTALIPLLPEPNRSQVFGDTLRLACALPTGNNRTHALGKLVPLALPDRRREIVVEALNASRLIEDEYGRFLTLIDIAQQTGGHVSSDAVARARRVLDGVNYCIHRSHALAAISPFLTSHEQGSALAMALSLALMSPVPSFRNSALLRLVKSSPRELQKVVIRKLMDDGSNDPFYALSLAQLVKKLPNDIRSAIIPEVLSRLGDSSLNCREEALLDLARFVEDRIRQQEIFDQIEIWIDGLESPSQRARYCAELANAERDISAARRRSEGIDSDIDRIMDNDERATVLVGIIVDCPEEWRPRLILKAYDAARACTSVMKKAHNLTRLVPYLGEADRAEGVALSFAAAKAVAQPMRRFEALRSIAPLLSGVQRQAAVDLLLDISAQLPRSHSVSMLSDLPSILPKKYHATVLLPAMGGLDEMAEWFP